VAKREIDERINGHLTVEVSTPSHQNGDTRAERAAASERRALRSLVLSAPPLLADFGLAQALRAQAARATVDVRLMGSAPRGTEAGVRNIRDRIEDLGGTFEVASSPGHGTVLTISLRWPTAADRRP
jgi:hypothetical protein